MIKKLLPLVTISLLVFPALADDAATPAAAPAVPAVKVPAATDADAKLMVPINDKGIGSDGEFKDENSYQVRIGELYAPGGEAYVLPFRIPTLPAGQRLAIAHLRTQLVAVNKESNGLFNVDLYGLGVRDSDKVLPTDYYQGIKPDTKATLIQAKFITPSSTVRTDGETGPYLETSAEGDAALTKYLTDIFSKPENAGKFVFLRMNYAIDSIADGNNAYMVLTTGADGGNEKPLLIYKLAP